MKIIEQIARFEKEARRITNAVPLLQLYGPWTALGQPRVLTTYIEAHGKIHFLYTENPENFTEKVLEAVEELEKELKEAKKILKKML